MSSHMPQACFTMDEDNTMATSTGFAESNADIAVYSGATASGNAHQHIGHIYGSVTNNYNQGLTEEDRTKKLEKEKFETIHGALWYSEMDTRRRDIIDAADGTFGWILQPKEDITKWLKEPHCGQPFWICGRAASGKSTLMKFIVDDDRTTGYLEAWADGKQLIIASHFFWHPGTALQKSFEGLLRSLLAQICDSDPYLLSLAFPRRWKGRSRDWNAHWRLQELKDGLQNIVVANDYRFCLFIDGLDEFHPHDETDTFASYLLGLAAIPNLKMCVSSRPWDPFKQQLADAKGLAMQLQDLNSKDIRKYARKKFAEASVRHSAISVDDLEALSTSVCRIAEGVFLWVRLVVRSLCDRIQVGEHRDELWRYLHGLPPKLEDYFREMIQSRIDRTWHSETALTFQLMLVVNRAPDGPQTLDCLQWRQLWITYKYGASLRQLQNYVYHAELKVYSDEQLLDMMNITRAKVDKCTGGLLILSHSFEEVVYQHRSVYDFLQTEEMQALIANNIDPALCDERTWLDLLMLGCANIGPTLASYSHLPNYLKRDCEVMHYTQWNVAAETLGRQPEPWAEAAAERLDTSAAFFHDNWCSQNHLRNSEATGDDDPKQWNGMREFLVILQSLSRRRYIETLPHLRPFRGNSDSRCLALEEVEWACGDIVTMPRKKRRSF